jgi:hypothetical protein
MAAMGATRPSRSRSLELLAVAVSMLLFTAPLLGLNCEIACAGSVARATRAVATTPAAQHCAPHGDSSPGRPSGAPPTSHECGHHGNSFVVKRGNESAAGYKVSIPSGSVPFPTQFAFDPYSISSTPTVPGVAPPPAAPRPRILRL